MSPHKSRGQRKEIWSWFAAVVWTGIIILTVNYGPILVRNSVDFLNSFEIVGGEGYSLLGWMAAAIIGFVGIIFVLSGLRGRRHLTIGEWGVFFLVTVTYGYLLSTMSVPTEKIHFIEYGVLALLVARALSYRITGFELFVCSVCVGYMVGLLDEFLQYLHPKRHGEIIDTLWNGISVLLSSMFIFGVWKPGFVIHNRAEKVGKPVMVRALVCMAILGAASFIQAISEFGYLIRDDEIQGIFRSRYSREALLKKGETSREKYTAILDRCSDKDYSEFLLRYPAKEYPYLHELRVHLWSRDRNLALFLHYTLRRAAYSGREELERVFKSMYEDPLSSRVLRENWIPHATKIWREKTGSGWDFTDEMGRIYLENHLSSARVKDPPKEDKVLNYLWKAYRENQLMNAYFNEVISGTRFYWPDPEAADWARKHKLTKEWFERAGFESKVSDRIFTAFRPWQMWTVVGILIVGIVFSRKISVTSSPG